MPENIGKYEILEQIGIGGFGTVYRGRDPFIKRDVAIKTCQSPEADIKKRFVKEAELAGNLQHRNIVTIYEFGYQEGVPYIVQEYLSGEDLDKKIKRGDPLPLLQRVGILIGICDGLEYAHAAGIVHRDLKPGNIRILEDGQAKIMDFGIAKALHSESTLTQTGITLGTAAYLAPEQIRGEPVSPRTDIFSLGVLSYELLTYRKPFRGEHISTILYKIMNERPEPPRAIDARVPEELEQAVYRAIEKDASHRYDSVDSFRRDLVAVYRRLSAEQRAATGETPEESGITDITRRRPALSTTVPMATPATGVPRATDITPPSGALARSPSAESTPSAAALSLELVNFREPSQSGSATADRVESAAQAPRKTSHAFAWVLTLVLLAAAGGGIWWVRFRPAERPNPARPARTVPTAPVSSATPQPPPGASALTSPESASSTATEVPHSTQAPPPAPTPAAAEAPPPRAPEAKAKPAPPKLYSVRFLSQPAARLSVDGKPRGETGPRMLLRLPEGEHQVRLEVTGLEPYAAKIKVGPHERNQFFHPFPPFGLVDFAATGSDWNGTRVLIDGKKRATLPLDERLRVAAGSHRLEVIAPNGYRKSLPLEVRAGKPLTIPLPPSPPSSTPSGKSSP
jgi:eukaryotic-like serine/threonine-protein kinase